MTEAPFSPTRNAIKPGKAFYTDLESGVPEGHGFLHGGDTVALVETILPLGLELRLTIDETLYFFESFAVQVTGTVFADEDLTLRELMSYQLNGGLVSGPERPVATPSSTLSSGFGNGGFGQLGFGGSISVTG